MAAASLVAAVAAEEAVAGKPSGGYLKPPDGGCAIGLFLFYDLTGKIPVWFAGCCYYSKLL